MVDFTKVRGKEPVRQVVDNGKVKPIVLQSSTSLPNSLIKVIKINAIKRGISQKVFLEMCFKKMIEGEFNISKINMLDFRDKNTYRYQIREDQKIGIDKLKLEHELSMQDIFFSIYKNFTPKSF